MLLTLAHLTYAFDPNALDSEVYLPVSAIGCSVQAGADVVTLS